MTAVALTTYRERSLHAALKARYAAAAPGSLIEVEVAGFVVDVASGDELIEIQTTSFASLRRKLVTATGRSKRLAMRAAYCLAHAGAVEQVGQQGRLGSYART